MATQSPGIYFNEIDNTAYENPKTTTGTIVCVVGYAKKGPIGEPTMITSWANFVSTFGKPVDGYYSGLAVKNILNVGGAVLFERVADATATPSNCVIKNPVLGTTGYVRFARNSDVMVGVNGYKNRKIYALKVEDGKNNSKIFYVRSPEEGKKLSQQDILSQLRSQNEVGGTKGTYEAVINSSVAPGLYSFKVTGEEIPEMDEVFVELIASSTKNVFVEAVRSALSTGSNAVCKLTLSKAVNGNGDAFSADDQMNITGEKRFAIIINDTTYPIILDLKETDTFNDLALKINNQLVNNGYPARCFLKTIDGYPTLVFVLTQKTVGGKIIVKSLELDDIDTKTGENQSGETVIVNTNNLFLSSKVDEDGKSELTGFLSATKTLDGAISQFSIKVSNVEERANSESVKNNFDVDYVETTNSIVFVNNIAGTTSTIEVEEGTDGNYLFSSQNVQVIGKVDGQPYLDIDITRGPDKKIYFTSLNDLVPPKLSPAVEEDKPYLDLLAIMKDPNDPNSVGYDEPKTGTVAVEASNKDMVVFTSKENGSETNNIVVEVYTSVSPIPNADGTYETKHDLTVTVDGLLKETYENISYDYADVDNRFDTKINESVENGGSNYITCLVQKNDFSDPEVQLPDGKFYIGKPNSEDAIEKDADVDYRALSLYDYAVGTDGIPLDGGSELFVEALEADVSKLANKELYDFHVLITPDDISEVVQTAAITLCENRRDAIAIIDPPIGLDVKSVIAWHNGRGYGRASAPTSNYAATYWPWCKIYDNSNGTGKYTWVMPSVVMAAKYVTVDKTAGCWYAPAGEQNGQLSVADIECYPNKLDRDNLYTDYNRVNPITKFKDGTIVVYGEKTLQRINSVLTKIHTRRMLVQVKKQCREAIRGYIFMPNTPDYLGKISSNVSAILETYRAGGGIQYYRVICDETNNPIELRQQDMINVDVVIVPNGTIEQVTINLTLNKNENTVSD